MGCCETKYWSYFHLWEKILSVDNRKRAVHLYVITWETVTRMSERPLRMRTAGPEIVADGRLPAEQTVRTAHHEELGFSLRLLIPRSFSLCPQPQGLLVAILGDDKKSP